MSAVTVVLLGPENQKVYEGNFDFTTPGSTCMAIFSHPVLDVLSDERTRYEVQLHHGGRLGAPFIIRGKLPERRQRLVTALTALCIRRECAAVPPPPARRRARRGAATGWIGRTVIASL